MPIHDGMPAEISFEEWVTHIFDHDDPGWHWDIEAPYWNPELDPQRALAYLGRLFAGPEILLGRFTPNQTGVGLNFLVNPSCSNYGFVFLEPSVPIEARVRGLRDIASLYEKLFAQICVRTTHHGRMTSPPALTAADNLCYMFWDVFPMYGRTRSDPIRNSHDVRQNWDDFCKVESACLDALERTLAIDHVACQEGALHGLGHWQMYYPERVVPIIDDYLAGSPLNELVGYAWSAREGGVL